MTLNDAVVTVALAYYLNGCCEAKLRRCANLVLNRLAPRRQKTIRLLLSAANPGQVLEVCLDKLEDEATRDMLKSRCAA